MSKVTLQVSGNAGAHPGPSTEPGLFPQILGWTFPLIHRSESDELVWLWPVEKSGVSKAAHDLGYLSKALFLARVSLIGGFSDYASLGRSLPCTLVLYLGCSQCLTGLLKIRPTQKKQALCSEKVLQANTNWISE